MCLLLYCHFNLLCSNVRINIEITVHICIESNKLHSHAFALSLSSPLFSSFRFPVIIRFDCIVSSLGTVDACKRKWKNLRDAYRALLRKADRRIAKDKALGVYDPNNREKYNSKWIHFASLDFIKDNKRKRKRHSEYHDDQGANSSVDDIADPQFNAIKTFKLDPSLIDIDDYYSIDDDDEDDYDDADDDHDEEISFEDFQLKPVQAQVPYSQNITTASHNTAPSIKVVNIPSILKHTSELEALRRQIPASISVAVIPKVGNVENHPPPQPNSAYNTSSIKKDCQCASSSSSKTTPKHVHFLENLEQEEKYLMRSTQNDLKRSAVDHTGDPDYNFLTSFLPQMKKMSELQNLQFRSRMCEMVLNILAPTPTLPPNQPPPLTAGPGLGGWRREPQSHSFALQDNDATSTSCIFNP